MEQMRMAEDQKEAILQNPEICCDQCNMPVPLTCWRYKFKFQLHQNKILAQADTPADDDTKKND